jgi:hypothetical protein
MTNELKPLSSISAIPELKDDGSNWFDFHCRLEEVLIINGYASTIGESKEPAYPWEPMRLADNVLDAIKSAYIV